jgi:hypothetical protein
MPRASHEALPLLKHALAAARLPRLSEDEQATVAAVAVRPLFDAWEGVQSSGEDVEVSDLQMQQCPLLGGGSAVL